MSYLGEDGWGRFWLLFCGWAEFPSHFLVEGGFSSSPLAPEWGLGEAGEGLCGLW